MDFGWYLVQTKQITIFEYKKVVSTNINFLTALLLMIAKITNNGIHLNYV